MIESNKIEEELKNIIVKRSEKAPCKEIYRLIGNKPFILAGGALCGDRINDFDIFPVYWDQFDITSIESIAMSAGHTTLPVTKNALTVKLLSGEIVQFCRYVKPNIEELVKSFDFSHIQVGVMFPGENHLPCSSEVFFTDEFLITQLSNKTEYMGSKYPLSSIIRVGKYYARERLTRYGAGMAVVKALTDVIKRGFKDYDDFKDQMDSIDLGASDDPYMSDLYMAACDAGLVKESDGI